MKYECEECREVFPEEEITISNQEAYCKKCYRKITENRKETSKIWEMEKQFTARIGVPIVILSTALALWVNIFTTYEATIKVMVFPIVVGLGGFVGGLMIIPALLAYYSARKVVRESKV